MKAKERLIYIELTDELNFSLCAFCRYAESIGCCAGSMCKHSLARLIHFPGEDGEVEPGCDCWAFRPSKSYSIQDFAEIAGTYIEQEWEVMMWFKRPDGIIEMAGAKEFY